MMVATRKYMVECNQISICVNYKNKHLFGGEIFYRGRNTHSIYFYFGILSGVEIACLHLRKHQIMIMLSMTTLNAGDVNQTVANVAALAPGGCHCCCYCCCLITLLPHTGKHKGHMWHAPTTMLGTC